MTSKAHILNIALSSIAIALGISSIVTIVMIVLNKNGRFYVITITILCLLALGIITGIFELLLFKTVSKVLPVKRGLNVYALYFMDGLLVILLFVG